VFFDWVSGSVEAQKWSEVVVRVSFFATVIATMFTMWATYSQARKIRENRSGESVSVLMFSYLSWMFVAYGYFGYWAHSVAIVFNSLCAIPYFLVLWNLWKYKGFTRAELLWSLAFPLQFVAVVVLPWKVTLTTTILSVSLAFMAMQPIEMYRTKSAGFVSMKYALVFLASLVFWTIFAYKTRQLPLLIVNPAAFIIIGATIWLWFKYQKSPGTSQDIYIRT
jgi:uncharacterized protein with PQ loop repeat